MMHWIIGFTGRFCPFLESHILGHFNPVHCREGGSGGLHPQSLCSIPRATDTKLCPTLLIHLHHVHRALYRAWKERAEPPNGHERMGTY